MSQSRQREGWKDLHLVSFVPRLLSASDLSDDNLVKSTSLGASGGHSWENEGLQGARLRW